MLAIVAFRSAKGAWIERSFRGAKGDNRWPNRNDCRRDSLANGFRERFRGRKRRGFRRGEVRFRRLLRKAGRADVPDNAPINGNLDLIRVLHQGLDRPRASATGRRAFVAPLAAESRQQGTNLLALDGPARPGFLPNVANDLARLLDATRMASTRRTTVGTAHHIVRLHELDGEPQNRESRNSRISHDSFS
jgi:hypothetical protein